MVYQYRNIMALVDKLTHELILIH